VRDGLVEAMLYNDKSKIAVLVKNLASLKVDAKMVANTGLHVLLRDQQIMCLADSTTKTLMKGRIDSWKRDFAGEDGRVRASERGHPFGGVKGVEFLTLVDHWESWLKGMDGSVDQGIRQLDAKVVTTLYRRAAATLVFHRIHRPELLDSILPDEAASLGKSAEEAGVLRRAALTATTRGSAKRHHEVEVSRAPKLLKADGALESSALALTPFTDGPKSAELVATRLSLDSVAAAENAWESSAASEGIPAFGACGPRAMVLALARAAENGGDVVTHLAAQSQLRRLETQRGSLPSMASALRTWHGFACGVLRYEADVSLPPRCEQHALWYVQIFRNGGTAFNYMHFLRFSCRELSLDDSWYSERVKAALQGTVKMALRRLGGTKHQQTQMTVESVKACVSLSDGLNDHQWSVGALIGWEFLLRMQSECMPLQWGSASQILDLEQGRHSAAFVDQRGTLHIRLARRKHRPEGSTLRRDCTCGGTDGRFCAPCRLRKFAEVRKLQDGDMILDGRAYYFLLRLRRLLTILQTPDAQRFTLKAFRSGKATDIVKRGGTFAQLLEAGEWRGAASLGYVCPKAVDHAAYTQALVDASSDEEVAEPTGT